METLNNLDERLFLYLNNAGSESWDGFWLIITDQWLAIPLYALLALLVLWKTGFKSAVVSGVVIIATVVFTIGISHAFKYGVARPRPCDAGLTMRYLFEAGTCDGKFGFFSTHASVALAMVTLIAMILKPYFKWLYPVLLVWVLLFCYSRIYVGKHYPGDIIVGLIFGYIIGILAFRLRKMVTKRYNI